MVDIGTLEESVSIFGSWVRQIPYLCFLVKFLKHKNTCCQLSMVLYYSSQDTEPSLMYQCNIIHSNLAKISKMSCVLQSLPLGNTSTSTYPWILNEPLTLSNNNGTKSLRTHQCQGVPWQHSYPLQNLGWTPPLTWKRLITPWRQRFHSQPPQMWIGYRIKQFSLLLLTPTVLEPWMNSFLPF